LLKYPEQKLFSIFIWHQPESKKFAKMLTEELRTEGFFVSYIGETEKNLDLSFHTIDWQLAKSDCIIFLISGTDVRSTRLQSDAEKVMRRADVFLIPAYIDKIMSSNLPMILQYIEPLEFYEDYKRAFEVLVKLIQRKKTGETVSLSSI